MYDELYAAWRLENENAELGSLPADFYARLSNYLRRNKEETQMLETKGMKATLLEREGVNAARMAQELTSTRYRKLAKMLVAGKKVPIDSLATEEQVFYGSVAPSAEAFAKFAEEISHGQLVKINIQTQTGPAPEPQMVHTRVTLRFFKPVPSIIGADMKSYGPFLVEDVASVPSENAKILIKQGLAKAIDVQQ
jgi:DNA replication initiation complex subunit (GINS family)